jgi:hypothetical protein
MIYRTQFGSRLYGTQLPDSDYDFKGVFLPTAEQILLGEAPKTHTSAAEDDAYSLKVYLDLLAQGQTVAIDMLFAPPAAWTQMDPIWYDVTRNRYRLLNRKCGAAIGYARAQAERYSLRGARITALEAVLDVLRGAKPSDAVETALLCGGNILNELPSTVRKYITVSSVEDDVGMRWLQCCGKSIGLNCKVERAVAVFSNLLAGYGDRSRLAQLGGADWKALYHAVRVTEQTIELLTTGEVTFPRPNAEDLVKIRLGDYPPEAVYLRIERGIDQIEAAQATSDLEPEPDREWMRSFVLDAHREVLANAG